MVSNSGGALANTLDFDLSASIGVRMRVSATTAVPNSKAIFSAPVLREETEACSFSRTAFQKSSSMRQAFYTHASCLIEADLWQKVLNDRLISTAKSAHEF